jgi:hypothetical protein
MGYPNSRKECGWYLGPWPFLLALEECEQRNVGNLDDLEPDSGNITDGVTLTTESGNKDFVVLFDEVETTVVRDEGHDLLAVIDQLDTHALADSGVRLLGFDTDLFKNDSLSVRSASEGVGLPAGSEVSLFVVEIGPSLDATVLDVLAGGPDTCGLTHVVV